MPLREDVSEEGLVSGASVVSGLASFDSFSSSARRALSWVSFFPTHPLLTQLHGVSGGHATPPDANCRSVLALIHGT